MDAGSALSLRSYAVCIVSLLLNTNCRCHLKPSLKIFCGLIFFGFVSASVTITKLSVKLVSLLLARRAPSESPELFVVSLQNNVSTFYYIYHCNEE